MCPYGPLLNEQTIGCSGTVQRDLCSATRNQTFSGGAEKLLFSCANFVDQTSLLALNGVIKTRIFIRVPTRPSPPLALAKLKQAK